MHLPGTYIHACLTAAHHFLPCSFLACGGFWWSFSSPRLRLEQESQESSQGIEGPKLQKQIEKKRQKKVVQWYLPHFAVSLAFQKNESETGYGERRHRHQPAPHLPQPRGNKCVPCMFDVLQCLSYNSSASSPPRRRPCHVAWNVGFMVSFHFSCSRHYLSGTKGHTLII